MRAFGWFVGLILLALAAMAVFSYPAWQLLQPHFGFPFHRVADRIGMLALALGFVLTARRLRVADRVSLGYGVPPGVFAREALLGFGLGVGSMALIVAIMVLLDLRSWRLPAPGASVLLHTAGSGAGSGSHHRRGVARWHGIAARGSRQGFAGRHHRARGERRPHAPPCAVSGERRQTVERGGGGAPDGCFPRGPLAGQYCCRASADARRNRGATGEARSARARAAGHAQPLYLPQRAAVLSGVLSAVAQSAKAEAQGARGRKARLFQSTDMARSWQE